MIYKRLFKHKAKLGFLPIVRVGTTHCLQQFVQNVAITKKRLHFTRRDHVSAKADGATSC